MHEIRKTEAESDSIAIKAKHKECEEVTQQLQSLTLSFTAPTNKDRTLISDQEYQALKSDLLKRKTILEEDLKFKNKAVEQWAELSEATFDFACYAHLWYENGDEKTKRAILACLGSNLTISNKILKVSYTSYFLSLIKAREVIEKEIEHARTSQQPMFTKQNRHFMPVLSVGLRGLDDVRTLLLQGKSEFFYRCPAFAMPT